MRESLAHVLVRLAMVLLIPFVVILGCDRGQPNGCPTGTVFHAPAGSCVNPSALEVDGDLARVQSVTSEYAGQILYSIGNSHHVRFPVADVTALDRIKGEMTAAGLQVHYSLVLELP
jgi:hypothetical protein